MVETVFWDTAAFVALVNHDDMLHWQAADINQRLAERKCLILTTSEVLTEVLNYLRSRAWRLAATNVVAALERSKSDATAEVVHVDEALWQRGLRLYRERPDKDWSLTDCISFVVMRGRGLQEAFTSDKHFEQAGFRPLIHA